MIHLGVNASNFNFLNETPCILLHFRIAWVNLRRIYIRSFFYILISLRDIHVYLQILTFPNICQCQNVIISVLKKYEIVNSYGSY